MVLHNFNDERSGSDDNWKEKNNISDFYKGANVFITGTTGFLGKILLEKLLRSCQSIRTIYILIRPKKNCNVEQRLKSLFESPVFDKLKESSKCFEKVQAINGDVALPNLGLSQADRHLIIEEVNIVFHLAAIVRFAGDLKATVISNTLGTQQITELCKEMQQLKSFIYVSTAFSNADKNYIKEIVYDPPWNPSSIITYVQTLPSDLLQQISQHLIGKYPNMYVFSKALAESIVLEYSTCFSTAIVRPSIINASWKEPFPGWVDGVGGAIGITISNALGIVKDLWLGSEILADLIPVDIVANTLITAAWHTATNSSNTLRVYNCTDSETKGITWKQFAEIGKNYATEYPSQYLIAYPKINICKNRAIYTIRYVLLQCTFAFIYDAFLYCTKRKPKIMDICKKTASNFRLVEFATFKQRNYDSTTFRSLLKAVYNAEDGQRFNIDMNESNGFDWDDYMKTFILGIRKHILKDDICSLAQARIKLNHIYWANQAIKVVFVLALFTTSILLTKSIKW